ncbi:hypothetical protein CJ179_49905 [Rhodococcus sp. ACS1]|uniref:hypothetical protein n=1 Tax=Rhodococcus sp. ACS1 TaxID=2028570 RepID=UPI000BB13623|nr:hypothetical protein [Rhodococcus sp. ACS1]PBC35075.1 hypothetical protein CJ179_49905 [Rhodococcus sp. ACS1]
MEATSPTRLQPESWRPTLPQRLVVGRRAGKAAAALAVACGLIHIPVLLLHLGAYPGTSLLMLALSCACLPCAKSLWNAPLMRDWGIAAAISASMLTLHLIMMEGMTTADSNADGAMRMPAHHHSSMPTVSAGGDLHGLGATALSVATALAVAQILLACGAMVVATVSRAHRARSQSSS